MTTTTTVGDAGQVFVDPTAYADDVRFHEACAVLRREDPIHRVEHPSFPVFWAITKHADVYDIELHPKAFTNAPVPVLADKQAVEMQKVGGSMLRELRGHRFEPGDPVLLSYPSANRDEEVFDDPFRFDVGRSPNPHLAFGFGAHYCLGAKLAKMEIKALLSELLPRLRSIELAGDPALMQTTFVGGLKHLPLRYELT